MRNLIIYFLLSTYGLFGTVSTIEPSPLFSQGEKVSKEALDFNLKRFNGLKLNESFKLAELTSDNKYIIAVAEDLYNKRKNKILIFDTQTEKIIKNIPTQYRINAIKVYKNSLFIGNSKGDIEEWNIDNLSNKNFSISHKKFYSIDGKVRKIYKDNECTIIDFYKKNDNNMSRNIVLKCGNSFREININKYILKNKKANNIIKNIVDIHYKNGIVFYQDDKKEIIKLNKNADPIPFTSEDRLFQNILSNKDEEFIDSEEYIDYDFSHKDIVLIKKNYLVTHGKSSIKLLFYNGKNKVKKLYKIKKEIHPINSITISNDKKFMLVVKNYEIKMYDIFNKELISTYNTIPITQSMVFSKDNKYLIYGTNTGYIHIWDIKNYALFKIIKAHSKKIYSMDISVDGNYLVTGSADDYIKIWDIKDINNIKEYDSKLTNNDVKLVYFYQNGVNYINSQEIIKNERFKFHSQNNQIYNIIYLGYGIFSKTNEKYKNSMLKESQDKQYILYEKNKNKIILTDLKKDKNTILNKNYKERILSLGISPNNQKFVSSNNNGNIFIYSKDGNLSKILKSKDDGSWIVIDKNKMKIDRGDNSQLWFTKNRDTLDITYDNNDIEFIFPKEINITVGLTKQVSIKIKNKTDKRFNFLTISLDNKDVILKANSLRVLKPHQTIDYNLSLLYIGGNQSLEEKIIFKAKVDQSKVVNNYSSKLFIKKTNLAIEKITIDNNEEGRIYCKNIGDINITLIAFIDKEIRENIELDINATKRVLISNNKKENEIINGFFLNSKPPYNKWDINKKIVYEAPPLNNKKENNHHFWFIFFIFIVTLIIILIILWISIRNKIKNNTNYLFESSPYQLKRKRFYLKILIILEKFLNQLDISKAQLDFTIDFLDNELNKENDFFKNKLQRAIKKVAHKKGLYFITLPKDFPLNIESFYLCIKDDANLEEMKTLRAENSVTIIIAKNKKLQRTIIRQNSIDREKYEKNSIPNNKIITPSTVEIMQLLLASDYEKALIELFVKYIAPRHISPFESKVSKYKYFDQKKEKIIYDLTSKKLDNLFIIGSDKSGKSYLLHKIEKTLKEKDNNNIVQFIQKNSYKHIHHFIHQEIKKLNNNNIIFLIDDVDNFILDKDTHKIFSYFKELNSQKNVFFIMTGFWTLYKEISLEGNSPLKGFAKVKYISDSLDVKLASAMINDYMQLLKIKFESTEMVDDIIHQTGGKLELINLISHQLLKEVNNETKVITREGLEKVLISKGITDYIDNLNSFDNPLEQIIIYGMLKKDSFSIKDVDFFLNDCAIDISLKEIKYPLKKLEIYDIIYEKDDFYSYKNLLFKKSLSKRKDIQQLLEMNIKNYNSILPTVKKILVNPIELYSYSYLKLHTVYTQLQNTKSIDFVINTLQIEKKSFQIVKDAFSKKTHNSFEKMIRLFSEKIKSTYIPEENYYLIKVSNDFPLGIQEFIIHFSNEKDYKVIKSLFSIYKITILITTKGIEAQNNLYENTLDKTDKFIAPKSDEITKLFLDPSNENVLNTLSNIFARHLNLNFISPYKANQGVDNASMFFGREQIITKVTQREPKNYLIVGARRVGKTSLLKAMHRKIENNRDIKSFFLTLSNSNIKQTLIEVLELNNITTFKELKLYLKKQKRQYIFFIDEVDDFIVEDRKVNYSTLKILREMSEERYAFFVLAGFWQLYQSKWEYQSPLLNFGEIIEIGELEINACRNLIIQPMKSMHINFESEKLIEEIIFKLGQKAQLISLICHVLIEIASNSSDKYCITKKDIKNALNHPKITEELGKWIKLAKNGKDKDDVLQKIIIYSMLENDAFNLYDIDCFFKKNNIHVNYEDIEYNLQLLVLSFYLKEENHQFSFRIPRQKELLLKDNIKLKLKGDMRSLNKYLDKSN